MKRVFLSEFPSLGPPPANVPAGLLVQARKNLTGTTLSKIEKAADLVPQPASVGARGISEDLDESASEYSETGTTIPLTVAAGSLRALNQLFWHMCWQTFLVVVTAVSSTLVVLKCSVKADLYIFGQVLKHWADFARHGYASLLFAKAVVVLNIVSGIDWVLSCLPAPDFGDFELDISAMCQR